MATFEDIQRALGRSAPPIAAPGAPAASPSTSGEPGDFEKIQGALKRPGIPSPIQAPEPSSDISFLQQGIARLFGLPVDISNAIAQTVGLGSPEGIFGGSASIERGFRALGIPTPRPGEQPQTPGAFIAREVGGAAAALPLAPLGAAVRGTGAVAEATRTVGRTAIRRPALTAGGELTAGAGAGFGAFAGSRAGFEDQETAEALGAIAGGFGLPALVATAPLTTRLVFNSAKKAFVPFTRAGAEPRAARRAQELAGGPEGVRVAEEELRRSQLTTEQLQQEGATTVLPSANLTPAQITGNRRLMALEREVLKIDNRLADEFADRFAQSNFAVRAELRALGGFTRPEATRQFLANRRDYVISLVGERAKRAETLAQQRIAELKPGARRETVNRMVRQEVEDALRDARAQEAQIWGAIPGGVAVETTNTRQTFTDVILSRNKADDPEDIPGFVSAMLGRPKVRVGAAGAGEPRLIGGKIKEVETVNTLTTLRSRILREQRAERAKPAPNRTKLSVLERLQGAILADLGALESSVEGELGGAIRTALDFSHTLNDKFTRGPVGVLLGFDRRGAGAVPEALTLEATVGRGGPRGAVELEALVRAGASPQQIEEFLKHSFFLQATSDGRVMPAAAKRFVERNAEILERFPKLKTHLQDAQEAQRVADAASVRAKRLDRDLHNKRRSQTALFLEAPVDQEVTAVLRSRDPAGNMRELVKLTRRDPTGDAHRGLKEGFIDFLFDQVSTGKFDEAGEVLLSGNRLGQIRRDARVAAAARELFSADELDRLDTIIETLTRLERSAGRLPDIGGRAVTDVPGRVIDFIGRSLGARFGAQAGAGTSGASLLTASFASRRIREIMQTLTAERATLLIKDAVQDPKLMQALLTAPTTPQREKLVFQRLNAWAAGLFSPEADEEREPTTRR